MKASRLGFGLGIAIGWVTAPMLGLVSFARRARALHPRGVTFHAAVTMHAEAPIEMYTLANRLTGPALVRFSGALWKKAQALPDVLGCAIRLRRDDRDTTQPAADDQDLLFATVLRPWTMPFSPFTTDVRDHLANDYFAVSPFDAGLDRPIYLRLHPTHPSTAGHGTNTPRAERLARDAEQGRAVVTLEVSDGPLGSWVPLATVSLGRVARVDGEALRFRPFRAGRGIHPRGFIHALRVGAYSLSQRARPAHTRSA